MWRGATLSWSILKFRSILWLMKPNIYAMSLAKKLKSKNWRLSCLLSRASSLLFRTKTFSGFYLFADAYTHYTFYFALKCFLRNGFYHHRSKFDWIYSTAKVLRLKILSVSVSRLVFLKLCSNERTKKKIRNFWITISGCQKQQFMASNNNTLEIS